MYLVNDLVLPLNLKLRILERAILRLSLYLSLLLLYSISMINLTAAQTTNTALSQSDKEGCLEIQIEGMACIPKGEFIRGSEAERSCKQGEVKRIPAQAPNHRPVSKIDMPTYYMDLSEVTYSAYQACVRKKNCPKRRPAYSDFSAAQQPMVGLSWYEAFTYCKAMGKHLPTE